MKTFQKRRSILSLINHFGTVGAKQSTGFKKLSLALKLTANSVWKTYLYWSRTTNSEWRILFTNRIISCYRNSCSFPWASGTVATRSLPDKLLNTQTTDVEMSSSQWCLHIILSASWCRAKSFTTRKRMILMMIWYTETEILPTSLS